MKKSNPWKDSIWPRPERGSQRQKIPIVQRKPAQPWQCRISLYVTGALLKSLLPPQLLALNCPAGGLQEGSWVYQLELKGTVWCHRPRRVVKYHEKKGCFYVNSAHVSENWLLYIFLLGLWPLIMQKFAMSSRLSQAAAKFLSTCSRIWKISLSYERIWFFSSFYFFIYFLVFNYYNPFKTRDLVWGFKFSLGKEYLSSKCCL